MDPHEIICDTHSTKSETFTTENIHDTYHTKTITNEKLCELLPERETILQGSVSSSNTKSMWACLGRKIPRGEIVYFTQMIVVFIVVITSLYNLSTQHPNVNLWTILLSSTLGYSLPNPRLERNSRIFRESK